MKRRWVGTIGVALTLAPCGAGVAAPEPADILVVNALVWTNDPASPAAEALAIRGGRFIAVGSRAEVETAIAGAARVLDARGRRVLPGLIDAHVHLAGAARSLEWLALRDATSRDEVLARVRAAAATAGPEEWILGRGWSAEGWADQRPPSATELDGASGGRPVVLTRMDGHQLLASGRALAMAGLEARTPDPPGGKFGRGADGALTGEVYEEAMGLVWAHVRDSSSDDGALARLLERAAQECARVGVTQAGVIESVDDLEAIAALDRAGRLPLRVAGTVSPPRDSQEEWEASLNWARLNPRPSERVRVIGFKGYMDGSLGSRTAWMLEPYHDDPHAKDNAGFPRSMAASGALREWVLRGAAMNLQPAVHAIGERANRTILDWFEEIPAARRARLRPRVEHVQHVTPEDLERFAALGVVASMQPLHKADDGRYAEQRLGLERLAGSYAFRTLLDGGAVVAFGSDWPVVSVNPFEGVAAAVTCRTLDGAMFMPEQAITVEEALRCYTSGSATALHSETETGMIRAGMAGDFIVLDRDVLSVPQGQIAGTKVLTTVVGGKVVHEAR